MIDRDVGFDLIKITFHWFTRKLVTQISAILYHNYHVDFALRINSCHCAPIRTASLQFRYAIFIQCRARHFKCLTAMCMLSLIVNQFTDFIYNKLFKMILTFAHVSFNFCRPFCMEGQVGRRNVGPEMGAGHEPFRRPKHADLGAYSCTARLCRQWGFTLFLNIYIHSRQQRLYLFLHTVRALVQNK